MSATGEARRGGAAHGPDQAGFTLIEALVVIAVTALVSGIVFPSVERSIGYWQFRNAVSAVQAALGRSRATALRQDMVSRFAPYAAGSGYGVTGEPPAMLPASIRILTSDARPIDFYRDGSSSGGTIDLAAGDRRVRFAISPATGVAGIVG